MSLFELWLAWYWAWKAGINFNDTQAYFEHARLSGPLMASAILDKWRSRRRAY